jgi:hypothetical protein
MCSRADVVAFVNNSSLDSNEDESFRVKFREKSLSS